MKFVKWMRIEIASQKVSALLRSKNVKNPEHCYNLLTARCGFSTVRDAMTSPQKRKFQIGTPKQEEGPCQESWEEI